METKFSKRILDLEKPNSERARPDSEHLTVQPRVKQRRPGTERRRVGGYLLRPGTPRGEGIQLGADRRARFRSAVPRVRSRKVVLPYDLETPRHGTFAQQNSS